MTIIRLKIGIITITLVIRFAWNLCKLKLTHTRWHDDHRDESISLKKKKKNQREEEKGKEMDGMMQMGLPVLGIVAAAAVTFYAVSFAELREVTIFYLFILL